MNRPGFALVVLVGLVGSQLVGPRLGRCADNPFAPVEPRPSIDQAGLRIYKDREAANALLKNSEDSARQLKFGPAISALSDAGKLARNTGDPDFQSAIAARLKELRATQEDYDRLAGAFNRLKKEPENAEANGAVGRFYGLALGDWDQAISHIAMGSDAELSELAKADQQAATAAQFSTVGDGWIGIGEKRRR